MELFASEFLEKRKSIDLLFPSDWKDHTHFNFLTEKQAEDISNVFSKLNALTPNSPLSIESIKEHACSISFLFKRDEKDEEIVHQLKCSLLFHLILSFNLSIMSVLTNYAKELHEIEEKWKSRKFSPLTWPIFDKLPHFWILYLFKYPPSFPFYSSRFNQTVSSFIPNSFLNFTHVNNLIGGFETTTQISSNFFSSFFSLNSYLLFEEIVPPLHEVEMKLKEVRKLKSIILSFIGLEYRLFMFSSFDISPSFLTFLHTHLNLVGQFLKHKNFDNQEARNRIPDHLDLDVVLGQSGREEPKFQDHFSEDQIFELFFSCLQSDSIHQPPNTKNEVFPCSDCFSVFIEHFQHQIDHYSKPSYYAGPWIKGIVGFVLIYGTFSWVWSKKVSILELVNDLQTFLCNGWKNYLEKPLIDLYRVIRYDLHQFNLVDQNLVKQNQESLDRMLRDYALSKSLDVSVVNDSQASLEHLLQQYESEIKSPLTNIFFGELSHLLLIQIQKQKVEIDQATVALDKLMRSNELNFQFLAIFPAFWISSVVVRKTYSFFIRQSTVVFDSLHKQIRLTIRNVERLLNHSRNNIISPEETLIPSSSQTPSYHLQTLPFYETGQLVLLLDELYDFSWTLPEEERTIFLEDLDDLSSAFLSLDQKLRTIDQMRGTYRFLNPYDSM